MPYCMAEQVSVLQDDQVTPQLAEDWHWPHDTDWDNKPELCDKTSSPQVDLCVNSYILGLCML